MTGKGGNFKIKKFFNGIASFLYWLHFRHFFRILAISGNRAFISFSLLKVFGFWEKDKPSWNITKAVNPLPLAFLCKFQRALTSSTWHTFKKNLLFMQIFSNSSSSKSDDPQKLFRWDRFLSKLFQQLFLENSKKEELNGHYSYVSNKRTLAKKKRGFCVNKKL